MAISGPLSVDFGAVFPFGAGLIGAVTPQYDFEASTKENKIQQRDRDSGLPVWVVELMDFDPEARTRTLKVKIPSAVQPVPPAAIDGAPVRPVVLENMTITPYIADGPRPKIAYSLRASGLAAPGRQARPNASAA